MKNPKERLTRTREERQISGLHGLVPAGFVFCPLVSTGLIWYQLSRCIDPGSSGAFGFLQSVEFLFVLFILLCCSVSWDRRINAINQ